VGTTQHDTHHLGKRYPQQVSNIVQTKWKEFV
jgi:hypothetical protein